MRCISFVGHTPNFLHPLSRVMKEMFRNGKLYNGKFRTFHFGKEINITELDFTVMIIRVSSISIIELSSYFFKSLNPFEEIFFNNFNVACCTLKAFKMNCFNNVPGITIRKIPNKQNRTHHYF